MIENQNSGSTLRSRVSEGNLAIDMLDRLFCNRCKEASHEDSLEAR